MAKPKKAPEAPSERLADLEDLRRRLLVTLDSVEGRDVAPVVRELRQVVREIDEIRKLRPQEGSRTDDLGKRRAARVAAAKNLPPAVSG